MNPIVRVAFLWCFVSLTLFLSSTSSAVQAADKPLRVTFLSPSVLETHPFWSDYAAFMEAAANSLGIDLTLVETKDRYEVEDTARQILSTPDKPDYLVYIYQAKNTQSVLEMAENVGVKSFITNTDVLPAERYKVDYPRGKFRHWIGHIFPDDDLAGRHLAESLLDKAVERKMVASDGKLHIIGIGGNLDSTASLYRETGLRKALVESPDAVLDHYVLADWSSEIAHDKAIHLFEIFPKANVYWAASDGISLGVLRAKKESGAFLGQDFLTGGINWSPEGVEAVQSGKMEATVGGHFTEGAWVLTLIYDYHHGKDFANPDATFRSQMGLINQDNVQSYLPFLDRDNWKKIDFKRFSKVLNPKLKEYDFSPEAFMLELAR